MDKTPIEKKVRTKKSDAEDARLVSDGFQRRRLPFAEGERHDEAEDEGEDEPQDELGETLPDLRKLGLSARRRRD